MPQLAQEPLEPLEQLLVELARRRIQAGFGAWLLSEHAGQLGRLGDADGLESAYTAGWRAGVSWYVALTTTAAQTGSGSSEEAT